MNAQKLKMFLIGSVLINIFLLGGILGGAYLLFWADQAPLSGKATPHALRFAAKGLSEERQRTFFKALRETRRDARPIIETARASRIEVRQLIGAPTFDRAAVVEAIRQTREADIAVRMRIENTLVDFAESLTPEERQKLAIGLQDNGPLRQQPEQKKPAGQ